MPWSGICQQQATVRLRVLSYSRAARSFGVVADGDAHLGVTDADGARLTLVCLVQAEQQRAKDAGDSSEAEVWRHKLHHYLDQLFQKDQTAGADYHVLQVCLILVNTCVDTHLVSLGICHTRRHITRIENDCYSCRLL